MVSATMAKDRNRDVPYVRHSFTDENSEDDKSVGLLPWGKGGCQMCVVAFLAFVIGGCFSSTAFYWHYSPLLSRENKTLRSELDAEMATADQANQFLMHRNAALQDRLKAVEAGEQEHEHQLEVNVSKRVRKRWETKQKDTVMEEEAWHNKFEEEQAELQALNSQDQREKHDEQVLADKVQDLLHERDTSDEELAKVFQIESLANVKNMSSLLKRWKDLIEENKDLRRKQQDAISSGVTREKVHNLTSTLSDLESQVSTLKEVRNELVAQDRQMESREAALRKEAKTAMDNSIALKAKVNSLEIQVTELIKRNNLLEQASLPIGR